MIFAEWWRFSTIWSEKTTPQPNVTPGALRSEVLDLMARIAQLHRDGEIEPRQAAS
jgi:hypothetical protein